MLHRNPTGDLEPIFDAALGLLLTKLEKERLGKTARPRARADDKDATANAANSKTATKGKTSLQGERRRRHIPTAIRREVFARDGGQCTFIDAAGNRCPARGYLELDHVVPKAHGGDDTAANLRVRCRTHNLWHAEQVFGRAYVEERIHLRRQRCAGPSAPAAPSFDAVTRGLRSLGFREPDVRAAMSRLRASLDPAASKVTILREALEILT